MNQAWYENEYGVIGATGADSVCDINLNSQGQWPVNGACYNSGTCVKHISFQDVTVYSGGECVCADPAVTDNFAQVDPTWIYGKYSKDPSAQTNYCNAFTFQMYSTISYIIYHSINDPNPGFAGIKDEFECGVGTDGTGIPFNEPGWETTPPMTMIARLMINYPGETDLADSPKNYRNYPGKVMPYEKDNELQHQHCKVCSLASPCTHPSEPSFTVPNGGGRMVEWDISSEMTCASADQCACAKTSSSNSACAAYSGSYDNTDNCAIHVPPEECKSICEGIPDCVYITLGTSLTGQFCHLIAVCDGTRSAKYAQTGFKKTQRGGYLMVTFASNFNTYYNTSCPIGDHLCLANTETVYSHDCDKSGDTMPLTAASYTVNPSCVFPDQFDGPNYDKGYAARNSWKQATLGDDVGEHHLEHYLELLTEPTSTPVRYPTVSDPNANAFGQGWSANLQVQAMYLGYGTASGVSNGVLPVPTSAPSLSPTDLNNDPDCFALGYTHKPEDLKLVGVAQAGSRGCRWGLETIWPGGNSADMCDSPYVICLPAENTPNVGFPVPGSTAELYKSATHQYTLDDCKQECAFDQRCVGFEFNANQGQTGDCVLLDDVPLVIAGPGGAPANPLTTETELLNVAEWSTLGGSVCYEKDTPCNPYFQESDLSEAMLNCYCPNNRKGFYTKNVVRTVAATKFCGSDDDGAITKRIREAQANRMFHLCENWCLFNTQDPRQESWYHDPWKQCWREQYAGIGTHRSYCYRVIRDPYTIEQLFIDTRSSNMCPATSVDRGSVANTPSPTNMEQVPPGSYTYVLADAQDSCDDACVKEGFAYCTRNTELYTNELMFANENPFAMLNLPCDVQADGSMANSATYIVGQPGWALPGVGPMGECILRNPLTNSQEWTSKTGCNVAIGVGYRRICSCSNFGL